PNTADGFVAKPKPLHDPGPEVLDDHVRGRDQSQRGFQPCRGLQVESDRALVPVGEQKESRDSTRKCVGPRPLSLPRAGSRRLDLDHVGAQVGEVLHRRRPEEELSEGGHPDAVQSAQRSHQSTSCMMWSATQTSSPRWLATSILEMILSFSGTTEVIA